MTNRYRTLSYVEGISLIALLAVAMPIKYLAGDPSIVKMVGPIHGLLFLTFAYASFMKALNENWPKRLLIFAIVTSSIPLGMILLERRLKKI